MADIYDALRTDRPYRKALGKKAAVEIMQKEAEDGKLDKAILLEFIDAIRNDLE